MSNDIKVRLTTAQRRHLSELSTNGPYWHPTGSEHRCAQVLAKKGLIVRTDHSTPPRVYYITEAGMRAAR